MNKNDEWNLDMSINKKACDLINGNDVKFTEKELYQIANVFGNMATILKRKEEEYLTNRDILIVCKEKFDISFVSIPKGATNGDMILGMNETAQVYGIDKRENIIKVCLDGIRIQFFDLDWWNAPYKQEVEE